jgi:hypothetical protein
MARRTVPTPVLAEAWRSGRVKRGRTREQIAHMGRNLLTRSASGGVLVFGGEPIA